MRDITLGITFRHDFTTRAFGTGIPTVLSNSPVLSVLEEDNATPITAGVSLSVDRASVVGLNEATIVATGGNGYEAGKSYAIYISTGTVDSVSVIGEVVGQFTVGQAAAAVDLANGTDGLTALKTAIDAVPTAAENRAEMDSNSAQLAALITATDATVLTTATIETVTDQTNFIIPNTADATDDNAYNGAIAVFIDGTDSNQKSVRLITDYDAGTRSIKVAKAPDFTITTSDTITVLVTATAFSVWDELLSSNHNINNSAGKRVRLLNEGGGYSGGAVYLDTANGTDDATSFEVGTDSLPCKTEANVNDLLSNLGLTTVVVAANSSIVFGTDHTNEVWKGENWTLALGGRNIDGSTIMGASVSGAGTNTSGTQYFIGCSMATVTLPGGTRVIGSGLSGTQTMGESGDYFYEACHSERPGTATITIDFVGTAAGSNLNVRHHSGGWTVANMGAGAGTDTATFEGFGQIIWAASCAATANASIRGHWKITDNAGGAVTETFDDIITDVNAVLVDTNELQGDWQNGGRLDNLLDAVNTVTPDAAGVAPTAIENRQEMDSNSTQLSAVITDTEDIQGRLPASLSSGKMSSDMEAISGDTTAADNLEALMDGVLVISVNDGSATTTAFAADGFTEATDDHFKGRLMTFITGALLYQQTDITGYDAAGGTQGNQEFAVTALTEAPAEDVQAIIH